jgi:hypothetical protein
MIVKLDGSKDKYPVNTPVGSYADLQPASEVKPSGISSIRAIEPVQFGTGSDAINGHYG